MAFDFIVGSDKALVRPFEYLHDVGFRAGAFVPIDPDHDAVAVHYPAHLASVQVKILTASVLENEKSITVRMRVYSAGHLIMAVGQTVMILFQSDHASFPHQPA